MDAKRTKTLKQIEQITQLFLLVRYGAWPVRNTEKFDDYQFDISI